MPLDEINDIRSMGAEGVSRSEMARRLHLSRNTAAKYADMGDMSPAAPHRGERRPRAAARRRRLGGVGARGRPRGAAEAAPHRQEAL